MTIGERIMRVLRSPEDNEYAAETRRLQAEYEGMPAWTPGEREYAADLAREAASEASWWREVG